jgi:isopropylmalate/homocitrate/citramalate synthase
MEKYNEMAVQLKLVDNFDIGFPGSGEHHKDQIVSLINFSVKRKHDVTFSTAGRGAAFNDISAIMEVGQRTGAPLRGDLFVDPSRSRADYEGWNRREKIDQTMENIKLLKSEGFSVMFVPERSSVTPPEELIEACTMAADNGVDRIAIADTTGVLDPIGTQNLFREVFERVGKSFPGIQFDFHEHDDLGMGTANCIVAVTEGVDGLHATARGIGERAGNVKLEELLVVLDLKGLREIDGSHIREFANMAADILNFPIALHESIVGAKSMETASGIHASAYAKGKIGGAPDHNIYLPVPDPEKYGLESLVRIGPMSGLANVYWTLDRLGMKNVTDEKAQEILNSAKEGWKILSDKDVINIVDGK